LAVRTPKFEDKNLARGLPQIEHAHCGSLFLEVAFGIPSREQNKRKPKADHIAGVRFSQARAIRVIGISSCSDVVVFVVSCELIGRSATEASLMSEASVADLPISSQPSTKSNNITITEHSTRSCMHTGCDAHLLY
jgi:hypothetical protein